MQISFPRVLKRTPATIVASYGRSGSTLLFDSAVNAMRRKRLKLHRAHVRRLAWTLAETDIVPGHVYKTHDFPNALAGRQDLRAVFVFGKATDAALSVVDCMDKYGPIWIEEHLDHLKAPHKFSDLLTQDALGLERQLDAWTRFADCPVLCVKYEALWDNLTAIQDFLQLPMRFPERRKRSQKDISPSIVAKLQDILGPLDKRVESLPDCFKPVEFSTTSRC